MTYVLLSLHQITGGLWREILIVWRISAQRAQRLVFLLIFKKGHKKERNFLGLTTESVRKI